MRTDLMLRGAALLEVDAVNPEGIKFNLKTWAADARRDLSKPYNYDEYKEFKYKKGEVIPVNCGTQACAVGLFAVSGIFKDENFGYEIDEEFGVINPFVKDTFGQTVGWEAVAKLLDITYGDAVRLFAADSYQGQTTGAAAELAVATRMREMVDAWDRK